MTAKKRTLEDVEDEIRSISRKRDLLIADANKEQGELLKRLEEYNILHPDFVQIICTRCGGNGYIPKEENKGKVVCDFCNGKCYLWMKKFREVSK